jgi:hypothetical protein
MTEPSIPLVINNGELIEQPAFFHLPRGVQKVASPLVVFECGEVSSVAGSPPVDEASEAATAGAQRPT